MAARDISPASASSTISTLTEQTQKQTDARIMSSASSSTSTPPTSLGDDCSVLSDTVKAENPTDTVEVNLTPEDPRPESERLENAPDTSHPAPDALPTEGRRAVRLSRKSVTTYNLQMLAGTAKHTPTKYLEKHHKNVLHGSLENLASMKPVTPLRKSNSSRANRQLAEIYTGTRDPSEEELVAEQSVDTKGPGEGEEELVVEDTQASRRRTSTRVTDLRKEALLNISGAGYVATDASSNGKTLVKNTLRRSASDVTHKSTRLQRALPVAEDDSGSEAEQAGDEQFQKPKPKLWLRQGLYTGQDRDFDPRLSETQNRTRKSAKNKHPVNKVLPLPLFAAERFLNSDPRHVWKDFKLPFDIYNPLPRKIKVDGWVKLSRNRFIGEASALWKREKQDSSQCYCAPEDGCGEDCHNRIMAYECDDTNCPVGAGLCANRPFAELKRRAKGNRYDYGVEVMETADRGYGVRAMRVFEPHQVIVEYAGEIITQSECERRMKEVYKKDKCYYLMSFDHKMIIDATRGTIARFVNHSCEPNCEMIKWTVKGEPRMALFAGPRGVMTGEELTYDYNFDPFSQKNIQECRCGTASCRGVLGPKPRKPVEDKSIAPAIIAGTKRKFQTLIGSVRGKSNDTSSLKRRKLCTAKSSNDKATAASEVANEQAGRQAAEHSRQVASRQSRALNRSMSATRRAPLRKKKASIRTTVMTKIGFPPRSSKEGALKTIKRVIRAASQRSTTTLPPYRRPSTPMSSDSEETEGFSIAITPASLRSASKKAEGATPDSQHGSKSVMSLKDIPSHANQMLPEESSNSAKAEAETRDKAQSNACHRNRRSISRKTM